MVGKLRAQCAKSKKFKDGYMISSGQPGKEYIDSANRHVLLRQVGFFSLIFICFCQFLVVFWMTFKPMLGCSVV